MTIRVLLEADVCEIREHELLCEYAADYLRRDLLISPSDHLTIVWKGGSTPDRRRMTKLMRGLIRAGFKNVGLVATEAHSRANSRGDV